MRHADYRVRHALRINLGKNDFPGVGCSKRCVERKGEAGEDDEGEREKGRVRHAYYRVRYALRDHLRKNDFPGVGCSKACVERKGEAGEDDRGRERERKVECVAHYHNLRGALYPSLYPLSLSLASPFSLTSKLEHPTSGSHIFQNTVVM